MRFIDTGINNGYMNMAIDEALLASRLRVLRFYQWKPACLSIGYFQSVKDINLQNLEKKKIQLVRRLTGGNAVLHDRELTYSFIIDEKEMPKSVIESYKKIAKALMQGLRNLGLNPTMNKNTTNHGKSPVCFNEPSWYEILVENKKIIGSAQKRINGKLLQHGAVMIGSNDYSSLFKEDYSDKLKNRMTSIREQLGKISISKVKTQFQKAFEDSMGIDLVKDRLTKKEEQLAKELLMKYSSDSWNFMR